MPIIPFGDEEGRLSLADRDLLWATMAYPRDEAARHEFMATFKLHAAATAEGVALEEAGEEPQARRIAAMTAGATLGAWLEPHGGFRALANARSGEEVLRDWYSKVWPGSIAGDILSYMLQMETSGFAPSVNKAVTIVADYLRGATSADGQRGPRSERYIRASWEEFKPVAHFWLGFRVWQFDPQAAPEQRSGPAWLSPLDIESLRAFLALAEGLANEVTLCPQGRRRSPIDPADFWRVSENIALPEVTFERPGLEDWALEIVRRYRRRVV